MVCGGKRCGGEEGRESQTGLGMSGGVFPRGSSHQTGWVVGDRQCASGMEGTRAGRPNPLGRGKGWGGCGAVALGTLCSGL